MLELLLLLLYNIFPDITLTSRHAAPSLKIYVMQIYRIKIPTISLILYMHAHTYISEN